MGDIIPPGAQPHINPGQLLLALPMGALEVGALAGALADRFPGTMVKGGDRFMIITLGDLQEDPDG